MMAPPSAAGADVPSHRTTAGPGTVARADGPQRDARQLGRASERERDASNSNTQSDARNRLGV